MKQIQNFALIGLLLAGCSNPADNLPGAKVSSDTNAPASASESAASAASRRYTLNQDNSQVGFIGSKVTGSHKGGFKKFQGELQVVNGKLADSGNKVSIDTSSLFTDTDRLTGHLKSPDFFDVAKFPTATFTTTSVTQGATNSTVTGNLDLHR